MMTMPGSSIGAAPASSGPQDDHRAPARGRSMQRTASTPLDRLASASTSNSCPRAPNTPWGPTPPHVQFPGETEGRPYRTLQGRRLPNPISAESLRSGWSSIRERISTPPSEPNRAAAAEPNVTHEEALDLVDDYIEDCARQLAAARTRARSHRKAMLGLMEYAAHLHATQGLGDEEFQYNERDPHSMTAVVRSILASLDVRLFHLRDDMASEDETSRSPMPELEFGGTSDAEDEWIDIGLSTPPDRKVLASGESSRSSS